MTDGLSVVDLSTVSQPSTGFLGFPVADMPPIDIEIIKSLTGRTGKSPIPQLPAPTGGRAGFLPPLEPNEIEALNHTCWPSFDCNSDTPYMPFEDPGSCIPLKADIARYL
eukprot:TRINITY_DN2002_c0_g1_i1.p2 TRINITY_DN2002_c0_g1~~TRINITY_DN2002_c0_g1_i1.p2  ORF type:complete len:110 (+),score=16.06 TRINITY_DN2002_c0_g1_i1:50-379(+)